MAVLLEWQLCTAALIVTLLDITASPSSPEPPPPHTQAKQDASEEIARVKSVDEAIKKKAVEVEEGKAELDARIKTIGNLVHDSVPVDDNEVRAGGHWGQAVFDRG